jgi:hypothetical protein
MLDHWSYFDIINFCTNTFPPDIYIYRHAVPSNPPNDSFPTSTTRTSIINYLLQHKLLILHNPSVHTSSHARSHHAPATLRSHTIADSTPLAPVVLVSVRQGMLRASALRFREQGFEGRNGSAPDTDVDLDDGPGVDGDGVEEGVSGLSGELARPREQERDSKYALVVGISDLRE